VEDHLIEMIWWWRSQ